MKEEQLFDGDSLDFDFEFPKIFAGVCTNEDFSIFSGFTVEGLAESMKLMNEGLKTNKDLKFDK